MSRYDHKIETSLEGIEHLSKDKNWDIKEDHKSNSLGFNLLTNNTISKA